MKHFGIVTGGITIALDGESALDEACGEWPLAIDRASYDLLQEIPETELGLYQLMSSGDG